MNNTTIISVLKVYTAQNVELDYPLANIGQRIAAALLDLIVLFLYILLGYAMVAGLYSNDALIVFFALILLPPFIFYYPLMEYFFNGQTVGKSVMKIRVMRLDGSPATLSDILLRWLLRVIDVNLGFILIILSGAVGQSNEVIAGLLVWGTTLPLPIVGIISIMKTEHAQRIGDLAANTVVVSLKRRFHLEDTILIKQDVNYVPVYPQVLQLKDRDIYLIKQVLEKSAKKQQFDEVERLAEKAKSILAIQDAVQADKLLKTLIKDYAHLSNEVDINSTTRK